MMQWNSRKKMTKYSVYWRNIILVGIGTSTCSHTVTSRLLVKFLYTLVSQIPSSIRETKVSLHLSTDWAELSTDLAQPEASEDDWNCAPVTSRALRRSWVSAWGVSQNSHFGQKNVTSGFWCKEPYLCLRSPLLQSQSQITKWLRWYKHLAK